MVLAGDPAAWRRRYASRGGVMRRNEGDERTVRKWVGTVSAAALLAVSLAPASAQQGGAPPAGAPGAAPQAPAGGRGGGGLNDACGGRSANPKEACPNDVTKMIATLGLLPDKPPATPQKP